MIRCARFAAIAATSVVLHVYAADRDCYVVRRSGDKVKGVALEADGEGTLKLQMDAGGPVQTFKSGSYQYAYVPKPKKVAALEKASEEGKHDVVLKYAGAVFDEYKYLGWGDYVAYLEGTAHIEQGDCARALQCFERGQRHKARHEEELAKGVISAYLGLKEYEKVRPILSKLMGSSDTSMAAFGFNTRGDILAAEGQKKEAVLDYLKTLLLFKPGVAERERQRAKQQAVELLKGMNDARWQDVAKID